ncbi:hypothetical protein BO79DRAFT_271131 [Aspergillus costaricaensis CBS 115574]|uniref:Uncharacterized protein n=1 Tax=Aspergillus costaricaensis CBS 115574 TaxID=1448317 RepID=A0ACD1I9C3_9EURO|nr:hypothetical protein BO79DRAFT_271131 [Aspergillus costaricaensis CBS 115574]RAK86377.1 hypothetical protein BO79DRAFT_271131 [Aspergillus costaricaensis CBS 115574]
MINPHLHLDTPQSHIIFIRPGTEPHTLPLSGSLGISNKVFLDLTHSAPNITISLVRIVKFDDHGSSCTHIKGRRRNPFRHGESATKQLTVPAYEETVLDCILWSASDNIASRWPTSTGDSLVYYFDIPVPNCLPPTMKTTLGTVCYDLKATINLPFGRTVSISKPLAVLYRLIPPVLPPDNYFRRFTASPLVIQTTISQQRPKDATTKAMFSVELAIRNLLTPGARDGEMKYIAISAIKWRVDEVAMRRNIAHCEMQALANTTTTSKRSLIEGKLEPRCPKVILNCSDQSCLRYGCLRVDFEIRIPESANAADEICESYCGGDDPRNIFPLADLPGIAINHELKVELITREDTFSGRTNKKLDRKPIAKLYGAIFPLRIHKLANDVDAMETYCLDKPPAFDVIQQMLPPKYEP